jgi:hypothetical protein
VFLGATRDLGIHTIFGLRNRPPRHESVLGRRSARTRPDVLAGGYNLYALAHQKISGLKTTAAAWPASLLICTKRIVGRRDASQIASASAASFFCRFTKGLHIRWRNKQNLMTEREKGSRPQQCDRRAGFYPEPISFS